MSPAIETEVSQLYSAVTELASGFGRISERLGDAYFLHLTDVDLSRVSHGARRECGRLLVDLRVIFRQVGAQSSIDEARSVELARRIVRLYDDLIR